METIKPYLKAINRTVEILNNGGVVIVPTDTVYGFIADATNKKAVEKIYKIKKRPKSKPLSLFVKDIKMAHGLAEVSDKQVKVLKKFWPGAYTFILKRKGNLLSNSIELDSRSKGELSRGNNGEMKLYGLNEDDVALRIPKHAFLQKLLKKINRPLAQTSVNISNEPPINKISDIIKQFGAKDILIIDGGDLPKGKPSKIIDLTKSNIKTLRT